MGDLLPDFGAAQDAFGVPATVTIPGGSGVDTVAVWLVSASENPAGGDFRRAEPRRVVVLAASDVPQVPRGTVVVAPYLGETVPRTWKVDSADRPDHDSHRCVVVEVTA